MQIEYYTPELFYEAALKNSLQSIKDKCDDLITPNIESNRKYPFTFCIAGYKNEDGTIVGLRYFFYDLKDGFCILYYIFVDPKYRNNGVSKELFHETINYVMKLGCKRFHAVFIDTNKAQESYRSYYRKLAKKDITIELNGFKVSPS